MSSNDTLHEPFTPHEDGARLSALHGAKHKVISRRAGAADEQGEGTDKMTEVFTRMRRPPRWRFLLHRVWPQRMVVAWLAREDMMPGLTIAMCNILNGTAKLARLADRGGTDFLRIAEKIRKLEQTMLGTPAKDD